MTPDVKHQVILLKDLYSVLENLDKHLQEVVDKNRIAIKHIEISSDQGILRIFVHTEDGRSIVQIFKKESPSSIAHRKLSCPPLV